VELRVGALDPGGAIGAAILWGSGTGLQYEVREFEDEVEAWLWIFAHADEVVIEDYTGAGYRDKWSVYTIRQVGAFTMAAKLAGVTYAVVQPGARKRNLQWALQELGLRPGTDPVHRADALAHARSYLEERRARAPEAV
jgi:hypothetical protein